MNIRRESMEIVAWFKLTTRCRTCLQASTHDLEVPDIEAAPINVDELLASAFLYRRRFACQCCSSNRTKLIAVTQLAPPEPA